MVSKLDEQTITSELESDRVPHIWAKNVVNYYYHFFI